MWDFTSLISTCSLLSCSPEELVPDGHAEPIGSYEDDILPIPFSCQFHIHVLYIHVCTCTCTCTCTCIVTYYFRLVGIWLLSQRHGYWPRRVVLRSMPSCTCTCTCLYLECQPHVPDNYHKFYTCGWTLFKYVHLDVVSLPIVCSASSTCVHVPHTCTHRLACWILYLHV